MQSGQRATLRVRADLIDRLVNEAGELSIARTRIEGEMRSLKGSLLELTENVIRLRRQLREIEIQAETQIQAKVAHTPGGEVDFDPLELDRFTRFQELTRFMAESVNDVATVQQSLLKNLDDANAAIHCAGAPEPQPAAGTDGRAHAALRQPDRTPVTGSFARRPRRWASVPTSTSSAARSISTVRCSTRCWRRSSTCCAMPWRTVSRIATTALRWASRKSAKSLSS